jgi:hypothetical protein
MYKYFAFISILLLLSCSQSSNKDAFLNNYPYLPKNQNSVLDQRIGPVIQAYQELIKGLNSKDTFYIHQSANQMVQLTDSIQSIKMVLDSNIQKIWSDGLSNLNAELQGLQITSSENNFEETKMLIHMCGLQLLNLLGQIGYKGHTVYIFNSENRSAEDGYIWLSLQKSTRDPFHPDNRLAISAQAVLQEAK